MARTDRQMNVRIPDDLRVMLEASAGAADRSLTAEIVARLRFSFDENAWRALHKSYMADVRMLAANRAQAELGQKAALAAKDVKAVRAFEEWLTLLEQIREIRKRANDEIDALMREPESRK